MKIPSEHLHFPLKKTHSTPIFTDYTKSHGIRQFSEGPKPLISCLIFHFYVRKTPQAFFSARSAFYHCRKAIVSGLKQNSRGDSDLTFEHSALLVKLQLILPFMVVQNLCRNIEAKSRSLFPASALTAADKGLPQSL